MDHNEQVFRQAHAIAAGGLDWVKDGYAILDLIGTLDRIYLKAGTSLPTARKALVLAELQALNKDAGWVAKKIRIDEKDVDREVRENMILSQYVGLWYLSTHDLPVR